MPMVLQIVLAVVVLVLAAVPLELRAHRLPLHSMLAFLLAASSAAGHPTTFCNPINIAYRFSYLEPSHREAADPTMSSARYMRWVAEAWTQCKYFDPQTSVVSVCQQATNRSVCMLYQEYVLWVRAY